MDGRDPDRLLDLDHERRVELRPGLLVTDRVDGEVRPESAAKWQPDYSALTVSF